MTIVTTDIAKAARAVEDGKLVGIPTETVYGLAGDATSDSAVASIYVAKGRPSFNPLIVHMRSIRQATEYVIVSQLAQKLAKKFWPGPLTLVMKRKPDCALSLLVSAGLDSVAVRVPAHAMAQSLLAECSVPVAAPSANRSGHISPTKAQHVQDELAGAVAMILDGGPCNVGLESTVVDVTGDTPVILRPGSITREMVESAVGKCDVVRTGAPITSPGMLERHYAPDTPLRLKAKHVEPDEALLAFGSPLKGGRVVENLSSSADLTEAAANLFSMLRKLDALRPTCIAVMDIPNQGIGVAINDRLKRAAN